MPTNQTTIAPNVWVIEGDDHEIRVVEAESANHAIELAAEQFTEQYGEPYSAAQCLVVGAFAGDIDEVDDLVFIPTADAGNEVDARDALDRW